MRLLLEFRRVRSEEHTSELQSHDNLVCRLLLEKKHKPRGAGRSKGIAGTPPSAPPAPRPGRRVRRPPVHRTGWRPAPRERRRRFFFFNERAPPEFHPPSPPRPSCC